ncbi:TPA: hypothetical protein QEM85_002134 [Pseudomonas putida]|uniref:hypothetical protein n=1 Tax=Pseudomonas putida TaxID=303 RepID=UPI00110CA65B|nr:hypothetical protein [Pseudomonas putida]MDD1991931.1 hypothetical protein [Pseudomonas putida]HDS0918498.1 hypothetical protein [Pseudomonas putida]HDS0932910.1 hypothetical protein [Pseudomonas putida]HDS1783279.1 hypothetical protein [Pseudomonas putida]HDS3798774.1 hypothetical protein [Pseudomonas putida]
MSMRMNIFGRYQGLDGDQTTTGAICIASRARGRVHGRNWLLQGDPTTAPGAHRAAIAWLQVDVHLRRRAGRLYLSLFMRHHQRHKRVTK